MCWITLTPKPKHHHHPGHHHNHSEDGSSVAELVRVHKRGNGPRYSKVRIIAPVHKSEKHDHDAHLGHGHHHHLPHMHPLHMHPIHLPHHHHHHHDWKIHGPGKKRSPAPPPPAPPSSRSPSTCPSPREPTYRTQIVEPAFRTREVRDTTRVALRETRADRGRLRRVAGYEVLGKEVPWDWDCMSSVASGRTGSRKSGSRLRYPPFGSMDRWM